MRKLAALICAVALASAGAAQAHVVFAETEAAPNAYYAGFLRIGHGCDGAPTRAVRVEIPENVLIARPQPKPGWTLEIERAPLATPIQGEAGAMITERIIAIIWRGDLPADQFDQFGIMMKLPSAPGPLYFPVTQTCAQGENSWTDIPPPGAAWHSVPRPAAVLNLVELSAPPAAQGAHH
jgi:uncharacterized protein YcnI